MQFSSVAIIAAAALVQPSWAFHPTATTGTVLRRPTTTTTTSSTFLSASTFPKTDSSAPGGEAIRSPSPIQAQTSELSNGKILEGGKVIDFEAVKGTSHAEQALAEARKEILISPLPPVDANGEILGINQDVISEVGHPLATFATPEQIQKCAVYLRSQAPPGLLKDAMEDISTPSVYTGEEKTMIEDIMRKAYVESGEVTGAYAKTFYMGTMLLPEDAREAIWAIYVWCRRTDEIVDAPRDDDKEMLRDLSSWELRLEQLWDGGVVQDAYDLPLLDVRVKYPTMSITPFMDMVRGMLMDVPDLGQDRYETFDELHLYCYRVAGTVGLMSLPVFGTAPGITYEQAREPALSLGVAFQITNILRDIGEDAADRGRIYLPRDDMARFGVTEDQLFEQRVDENFVNFMKFQIERAKMYYERARRGVFMLAPESRLPVQSSLDAYGRILEKIEANGYDCLTQRAYVDKWEKLSIIPASWYRTLDVSRHLPLPGDQPVKKLHEPNN